MKLERSKEWYARRIALEGDVEIGAGAPPRRLMPAAMEVCFKPVDMRIAFGTFVELWRRNRCWEAVKLAEEAGVNPEEILEIDRRPQYPVELKEEASPYHT